VDAGKAGGRVREATEADEMTPLENVADGPDDEVRKVQAWILAYRKRTLEGKLPAGKEETVNV